MTDEKRDSDDLQVSEATGGTFTVTVCGLVSEEFPHDVDPARVQEATSRLLAEAEKRRQAEGTDEP